MTLAKLCTREYIEAYSYTGLDATKPVFRVSEKPRLKPVSSATKTSQKVEISLVASLDMILSNKQIIKTLIRLRRYLLFANRRRLVFLLQGSLRVGNLKLFFFYFSAKTYVMGTQNIYV